MTTLTNINNKAVQLFITYSNNPCSKPIKEKRIELLESELLKQNIYLDDLFPMKQYDVLEHILYCLSANGIMKTSIEHLASKLEVSERTVSNAIKSLKQTNQFLFTRLKTRKTNNGKLVMIDKMSVHFSSIMSDVFKLDASQFATQDAIQRIPVSVDTVSVKQDISSPNYINSFNSLSSKQESNIYIGDTNEIEAIKQSIDDEPVVSLEQQKQIMDQYSINQYQSLLFEFIESMNMHEIINQSAYKIALVVGSDAEVKHFIIAKDVLHNINMRLFSHDLAITTSIRSVFEESYRKALQRQLEGLHEEIDVCELFDKEVTTPTVKFYNWLEERGGTN